MVRKEDYDKYGAQQRKANAVRYEKRRVEAILHYGDKCYCCRESHIEFLLVADKNGNPLNHDTLKGADFPEGPQVLCRNCAHAMKYRDECPHQHPLSEV